MEKEIANISGKEVISAEENVEIIHKKGVFKLLAKIDTGEQRSIIDEKVAMRSGLLEDTKDYDDEKSTLKLNFSIKNKRIKTIVDVEKIPDKKYKMIIGSRDLQNFLVDTSKTVKVEKPKEKKVIEKVQKFQKTNLHEIDQNLTQIDNKIKLLYHLRPINLESEKEKFFKNTSYNPQFEYPQLKFNPLELIDKLEKTKIVGDSPLEKIFENKKQEIQNKIMLLESIDESTFSEFSIKLFSKPSEEDVKICEKKLIEIDIIKTPTENSIYNAEDAKKSFEEVFEKYGLKNWKVKIKETMVTNCVAGKNNCLFLKRDAKFSKEGIESLIIHEIETHILTAENGKTQPYEIFNRGLANYLITQEGLAMYNVEKQRHMPFDKNFGAIVHVISINKALKASFSEVYNDILKFSIPPETCFRVAVKAKRGFSDTSREGAFTKDYIYYKGYYQIKNFIDNGGDIKDLYIGKININDLETIKKIPGITKAKILPTWLKN
jgi:uncharacterized protein (TIGR02421 family)